MVSSLFESKRQSVGKEFDTYKIGTTANSTSTMHKIMSKPITLDCFEIDDFQNVPFPEKSQEMETVYKCNPNIIQEHLIPYLEYLRQSYNLLAKTEQTEGNQKEMKKVWKELIRWLPESWLQTRTVTLNYENLLAMCSPGQRRFHKLTEWSESFMNFARSLPYAEDFIFCN